MQGTVPADQLVFAVRPLVQNNCLVDGRPGVQIVCRCVPVRMRIPAFGNGLWVIRFDQSRRVIRVAENVHQHTPSATVNVHRRTTKKTLRELPTKHHAVHQSRALIVNCRRVHRRVPLRAKMHP